MPDRRFPPPWSVEELEARFVVREISSNSLAVDIAFSSVGSSLDARTDPVK
jgi:uncharacterized protein (UPF0212 family)